MLLSQTTTRGYVALFCGLLGLLSCGGKPISWTAIIPIQYSYLVNCGGEAFNSSIDKYWDSDSNSDPSKLTSTGTAINATASEHEWLVPRLKKPGEIDMYATARYFSPSGSIVGNYEYIFPVYQSNNYVMRLYFAAIDGALTQRAVFSIELNGTIIKANFTPSQEPIVLEYFLSPAYRSILTLRFLPLGSSPAYINGIELFNSDVIGSPKPSLGFGTGAGLFTGSSLDANVTSDPLYESLGVGSQILETVYRIDVGGDGILEDRVGREWELDDVSLVWNASSTTVEFTDEDIQLGNLQPAWVPLNVLQNQRSGAGLTYNFSVPAEETYIIRLTFSGLSGSHSYSATSAPVNQSDVSADAPSPSELVEPISLEALANNVPFMFDHNATPFTATWQEFRAATWHHETDIVLSLYPSARSSLGLSSPLPALSAVEILREVSSLLPEPYVSPSASYSPSAAASALKLVYLGLGEPPALASWHGNDPCQASYRWTGVGCQAGAVYSLVVRDLSPNPKFTPKLRLDLLGTNLSAILGTLRFLWVTGDSITGDLPGNLGQLSQLLSLRLNDNAFYGSVPESLRDLVYLQELLLDGNNLSGAFPAALLSLQSLTVPINATGTEDLVNGTITGPVLRLRPGNDLLCSFETHTSVRYLPACKYPPPASPAGSPAAPPQPQPPALSPAGSPASPSSQLGLILAGGILGGVFLLVCSALVGCYGGAFLRSRRKVGSEGSGDGKGGGRPAGSLTSSSSRAVGDWQEKQRLLWGVLPLEENVPPQTGASLKAANIGLSHCRVFSFEELLKLTDNFAERNVIGSGGFGKVYRGVLEDGKTQVAIKRHVEGSGQGSAQFFGELAVLSKVRHKHLVTLTGFCYESPEMILVYEFIPGGTLRQRLLRTSPHSPPPRDGDPGTDVPSPDPPYVAPPFPWRDRLEVAIGAARGIEYLHFGLSPPIIHRDVKSTNILLESARSAKVADFGLSRDGPNPDETHVSTAVRGSFGYVDPEYYKWLKLTQKSDVYSFAVVLLELLAGRKVIDMALSGNQVNLVEWARPYLRQRKVSAIVDKVMNGEYSDRSMAKVADLILRCLQEPGTLRPSMETVVRDLEIALKMELNPEEFPQEKDKEVPNPSLYTEETRLSFNTAPSTSNLSNLSSMESFLSLKKDSNSEVELGQVLKEEGQS